jgi:rhodanese-related sulfurtransferase
MLKDLPGTFEVVDIRPADQVADYNPTGARAVDLGDLLENQTWLAGDVPLVVIDRDGTLAMMAAGILSRKTRRPLKALVGGVEDYWRTIEMKFNRDRMITPAVTPDLVPIPVQPQTPPVEGSRPGNTPVKPVRKGAGC